MGNNLEENIRELKAKVKGFFKLGAGVAGFIFVISMVISSIETVETGYWKHYQNTMTGKIEVYDGPDWFLRPPMVSSVEEYKISTTLAFVKNGDKDDVTYTNDMIPVSFADTYSATIPMEIRLDTPTTTEERKMIHTTYRSYKNLVRALYVPTIENIVVNTANQFTAEEIFQGGLNSLKAGIEDQAKNGVFKTERKQVASTLGVTETADAGNSKVKSKTTRKQAYIWKAVPRTDEKGVAMRSPNPFTKYGVVVSQTNMSKPYPEERLERLLTEKKELVAKKISSVQRQENAKAEIETAKLEGEALRVKEEQKKLINADAEIIEKKKEVQLANQQALKEKVDAQKEADLAIINKTKDLQMAKADEGIQKANYAAAQYEAKAKLVIGLAEAKVEKAKYEAIDKEILTINANRDIAEFNATAFQKATINLPDTVIMNGGSEGSSDKLLQNMANFKILDMKNNLQKTSDLEKPNK